MFPPPVSRPFSYVTNGAVRSLHFLSFHLSSERKVIHLQSRLSHLFLAPLFTLGFFFRRPKTVFSFFFFFSGLCFCYPVEFFFFFSTNLNPFMTLFPLPLRSPTATFPSPALSVAFLVPDGSSMVHFTFSEAQLPPRFLMCYRVGLS